MLTFEKAYEITQTIGSHTSFEKEECEAYFDILMSLPAGFGSVFMTDGFASHPALSPPVVEVGLEFGRSSSIAIQVAQEKGLRYIGIDPFDGHPEIARSFVHNTIIRFGYTNFALIERPSTSVTVWEQIQAILIDGDHSYEGVLADCNHFLPHVVKGGYAMFHDFRRESLPDVTKAVTEYFHNRLHWMQLPIVGTLGIWRKL